MKAHNQSPWGDAMKTLLDADAIATRIAALGREIRETYGDEPITAIAVLKGSFMFLADLVRAIDADLAAMASVA